jgi:hypothetical protein
MSDRPPKITDAEFEVIEPGARPEPYRHTSLWDRIALWRRWRITFDSRGFWWPVIGAGALGLLSAMNHYKDDMRKAELARQPPSVFVIDGKTVTVRRTD